MLEAAGAVQSVPCRCSLRSVGRWFGQRGRQGQDRLSIRSGPCRGDDDVSGDVIALVTQRHDDVSGDVIALLTQRHDDVSGDVIAPVTPALAGERGAVRCRFLRWDWSECYSQGGTSVLFY